MQMTSTNIPGDPVDSCFLSATPRVLMQLLVGPAAAKDSVTCGSVVPLPFVLSPHQHSFPFIRISLIMRIFFSFKHLPPYTLSLVTIPHPCQTPCMLTPVHLFTSATLLHHGSDTRAPHSPPHITTLHQLNLARPLNHGAPVTTSTLHPLRLFRCPVLEKTTAFPTIPNVGVL
jgi:hypothetical protein